MSVFSSSSAELMIWCDWLVTVWITEDLSEAVFVESDKIARGDTMRKKQLEDCVADERGRRRQSRKDAHSSDR